MADQNLKRLIRKAQRGDAHAFEKLISMKRTSIVYLAYKTLKNESDAEDAVQEAVLGMSKDITKLENPEAFSSWMVRRVYWACLNFNKKRSRQVPIADGAECEEVVPEERHDMLPESHLDDQVRSRYLGEKLEELSDEHRECLHLYYFEELTYAEIASILEIDEKKVANRLTRGRQKLRELIEKDKSVSLGAVPLSLSADELSGAFASNAAKVLSSEQGQVISHALDASLAGVTLAVGTAATTIPTAIKVLAALTAVSAITAGALFFVGLSNSWSGEASSIPAPITQTPRVSSTTPPSAQDEREDSEVADEPINTQEDSAPEIALPDTPQDAVNVPQETPAPTDSASTEIENRAYFQVFTDEEAEVRSPENDLAHITNSTETGVESEKGHRSAHSGESAGAGTNSFLSKTGDTLAPLTATFAILASVSAAILLVLSRKKKSNKV